MFKSRLSNIIAPLLPFVLLLSEDVLAQTDVAPEPGTDGETPAAPTEVAPTPETAPAAEPAPEEAAEAPAEEAPPPAAPAETEEAAAAPAAVAAPAEVIEPPAPSLLPLKVGTDVWSRFEFRSNYDELGVSRPRFTEGDVTVFRTRLTVETNPLQLTPGITGHVYIAPQASGQWGTQGVGGTVGEANLGIYEGYFMLKGKKLEGKVGRFAMNYGDALIIGNLDWHQSGRAFDGAHFRYKAGAANIDAFFTQTSEGAPLNDPFMAGDNYFWGMYAQLGAAITEGLELDLYALGKSAAATDVVVDATTVPPTTVHKDAATNVTLGARVKQKLGMIDYRAEGGIQMGKAPGPATPAVSRFAYQASAELGVSPAQVLRLSVGGDLASGDDAATADKSEAYDELYPTTHKWLGLMDVIGLRTNVLSANVKVDAAITPATSVMVQGFLFARMEENGLGRSPTATSDFAGYEIDAQLLQKIGKMASARALYGVFLPNGDHYLSDSVAHYLEIQAGLKF